MSSSGHSLPTWTLTPKEEKEAYKNWKDFAYKACDESVKAFAECSKREGLFVTFNCKETRAKMTDCIRSYQDLKYLDIEREKIIAKKDGSGSSSSSAK